MPTRKQKRVAEILAEDKDIPVTKALVKAGYAKTTAYKQQSKILDSRGAKEAIAAVEAERSDSARGIKRLAAAKIRERLEDGSASDALAVTSWKTAHEIAQDEPASETRYDHAAYRARLRRALNRAAKVGEARANAKAICPKCGGI